MCFTQPQFFWMSAPTSWFVCLRNVVTQDKRCSCGSRTFRTPSPSRTQKHYTMSVLYLDDQPARVPKYHEIVCEGFPCRGWKSQRCSWRQEQNGGRWKALNTVNTDMT